MDAMKELPAKFRDYDSTSRGTLCLLYTDGGYGKYLGQVYLTDYGWHWDMDDDDADNDGEEDTHLVEPTRRAAKKALRNALKEAGRL